MLQPLTSGAARRTIARSEAVPPPVGGLNTRDALDLMPKEDAVLLDNWFPKTSSVHLRKGYQELSTSAMAGAIKTLAPLPNATPKLVAAGGGSVYDATSATPSSLASGFARDEWQYTDFRNRLFAVNGVDAPWRYDGTTFDTATGFTGVTLTNLVDVKSFKSRLYFVEKDSQSVWYGGVDSITGALTEFDASGGIKHGGTINSINVITADGGTGGDDLFVIFMSSGEVVIYGGSYPGDSGWGLVGSFLIGAPVGRRNSQQVGGDVVAITMDGFVPLTSVLPFGRARDQKAILSDKIRGTVSDALDSFRNNPGWQCVFYPLGEMLIFNVPVVAGSTYHQYVMNLNTSAWCTFSGIDGHCWAVLDDAIYFGGTDGKVYQADTGTSDNGSQIVAEGATAWNYFGHRDRNKLFGMARPIFRSDGDASMTLILNTDFNEEPPTNTPSSPVFDAAIWDEAIWDDDIWAGGLTVNAGWQSVSGIGYVASLRLRVATDAVQQVWDSTTYTYQLGEYV